MRSGLTGTTASLIYLVVAIGYTWPLARGLASDVPWDLGDPLLNLWILGWGATHLLSVLGGDVHALSRVWHANIFHPEPLTLAYSEHLFAQAVQILPIYALTGNLILCYNLLFLSSFVLSGLAMFLFVRQTTGSATAGFVAGLVFAFMPARLAQFSHLQLLSAQWMPFVLFGLRRYFETGSRRALGGAAAALVTQNLSCGYYLLYFSPFVGLYALSEVVARRRLRDRVIWRDLAGTAVIVVLATVPFFLPYLELRTLGFPPRPLEEVVLFSADVYSYLTTHSEARLWGQWWPVRVFPKPAGDLFMSFAAMSLALVGVGSGICRAWRASSDGASTASRSVIGRLSALIALLYAGLTVAILAGYGFTRLGPFRVRVTSVPRTLTVALLAALVLLAISGRARSFLKTGLFTVPGFSLLAVVLAFVLSLGPSARAMGQIVWSDAPYLRLYEAVPGFDGLRVAARHSVVVMLFTAVLAGYGAALLGRRWPRAGRILSLAAGLLVVIEGTGAPIDLNGAEAAQSQSARLLRGDRVPPEYQFARTLPADAVLVEFPFGRLDDEVRYVYYSTEHWRRLVNGYSGTFPSSYERRAILLRDPMSDPERSWEALVTSGASHAIVHERAYEHPDQARAVTTWLIGHGSRLEADLAGAKVFGLPSRTSPMP